MEGQTMAVRVVDILAFGDSLTKGYCAGKDHPYTIKLLDLLEAHFPNYTINVTTIPLFSFPFPFPLSLFSFLFPFLSLLFPFSLSFLFPFSLFQQVVFPSMQIKQAGQNGESVETMHRRLQRLLQGKKATGRAFTHVIILGGTNDLGNPTYVLPLFPSSWKNNTLRYFYLCGGVGKDLEIFLISTIS